MKLGFYDHHRQSYGHMPIRAADPDVVGEFMIGDYTDEDSGVRDGGEFAIHLVKLSTHTYGEMSRHYLAPMLRVFHDATGSLRAFLDSGAWDAVHEQAAAKAITRRDDLTSILTAAGLFDRSDHPVGHVPVCHCCGRPTADSAELERTR